MSFDHDAAGGRGVERQQLVEELLSEVFALTDTIDQVRSGVIFAELHAGLFCMLNTGMYRAMFLPDHAENIAPVVQAISIRVAEFTRDQAEHRYVLLMLIDKLYGSATSQTRTDFAVWEMEKFQEQGYTLRFA